MPKQAPEQIENLGVNLGRRSPASWGHFSTPDHMLASCPPHVRLTLAARNEDELSDADVLGMLLDLEELGIVAPEDSSGSRS